MDNLDKETDVGNAFWTGCEDGKDDWVNGYINVTGMKMPVSIAKNSVLVDNYRTGYARVIYEGMKNGNSKSIS